MFMVFHSFITLSINSCHASWNINAEAVAFSRVHVRGIVPSFRPSIILEISFLLSSALSNTLRTRVKYVEGRRRSICRMSCLRKCRDQRLKRKRRLMSSLKSERYGSFGSNGSGRERVCASGMKASGHRRGDPRVGEEVLFPSALERNGRENAKEAMSQTGYHMRRVRACLPSMAPLTPRALSELRPARDSAGSDSVERLAPSSGRGGCDTDR